MVYTEIPIESIDNNPFQTREEFDPEIVTGIATSSMDELGIRGNPRNSGDPAPVDFAYDMNKDHLVNSTDELIARGFPTNFMTALRIIDIP